MAAVADPQTSLDERLINAPPLEQALETREKRKASLKAVRAEYREADEMAKAQIAEFDLSDGEVARCGRFRIAKKRVQGRSVSFETDPTSRLQISLIDEAA